MPLLFHTRLCTNQSEAWEFASETDVLNDGQDSPENRRVAKQRPAPAVPLRAAINNKRAHRLVQIAVEMPPKKPITPPFT